MYNKSTKFMERNVVSIRKKSQRRHVTIIKCRKLGRRGRKIDRYMHKSTRVHS